MKNPSRNIMFIAALTAVSCTANPMPWKMKARNAPPQAFVLPEQPPETLRVMSYNVFLRPEPVSFGDETTCRAQRVGGWLSKSDLDFVALTETFQPRDVGNLAYLAARQFPHQVLSQPAGGVLGVSGGLSFLSRWPIESTRTTTYEACSGILSDCVAAKGALHAVVRLSKDHRVNVVVTHLDAGRWDSDRAARAAQLEQLRDFMAEIDPEVGPTIVMGDFNIDALVDDGEYDELVRSFRLHEAKVDKPSTMNCNTSVWCDEPIEPRQLDYVFTSTDETRLRREVTYHHPMADSECGTRWLSDHRAVIAGFSLYD